MDNSIGWAGFALAAVTAFGTAWNTYQNRKAAAEKAESDRLAARDKMEFDAKVTSLTADIAECREDRDTLRAHQVEGKADRDRLGMEVGDLKQQLATARAVVADLQKQVTENKAAP